MPDLPSFVAAEETVPDVCREAHAARALPARSTRPAFVLLALAAAVSSAAVCGAGPLPEPGAGRRRLAIEKLGVVGSALYIGAHPDDENTAMLAWLAQGRKVRTGYLSLTRGDGGQNLIGTEQGPALGVVRTEELLAARRIDGAEQFFTRAIDFGYSKGPEETLRIWGHDAVLSDVVWVIRTFRPDVIITRFPTDGSGGHGHHTTSALLAVEAFSAAADPTRFPEQLRFVKPWQAKRLLWNAWRRGSATPEWAARAISVDLGTYEPLLGQSFAELAAAARSMHKSQGFGSAPRMGSMPNDLVPLAGEPPKADLFDGIDLSWKRIPGGERVGELLAGVARSFDDAHPDAAVPGLLDALDAMDALPPDPWLAVKRADLLEAVRECAGVWLEADAADPTVTPGGSVKVKVEVLNRSSLPITVARIQPPFGAAALAPNAALPDNQLVQNELTVAVPADAATSEPYWLREPPTAGLYTVTDERMIGRPHNPPAAAVTVVLAVGGHELGYTLPVLYRWTDPVEGERTRDLAIVPPVTVDLGAPVLLFGDRSPRPVRVVATAHADGVSTSLRCVVPAGWRVDPVDVPLSFAKAGDETEIALTVTPPSAEGTGELRIMLGGARGAQAHGLVTIDHPYIPVTLLLSPAEARLVRVDVARPVQRIGYIMGPGDEIPDVLRQLGFDVQLLSDGELESGDLSSYQAIVVGVRAYNTRPKLAQAEDRLLAWVEAGGNLVVQYTTAGRTAPDRLGPYPMSLSHDRVTDETAPVTFLAPASPLLTSPEKITAADFEGWIQERGLYFPDSWDAHYTPLLAMSDPGEKLLDGSLLFTRYGKGSFVYTGLAFFRQLPAGVPGAVRLFVNLLAGGRA